MKADAPLRIDPDAPLPAALPLQRFEPVARRRVQADDGLRRVDHQQLAARERLHVKRQRVHEPALKDSRCSLVAKCRDHGMI
jgi:hypothetical protein